MHYNRCSFLSVLLGITLCLPLYSAPKKTTTPHIGTKIAAFIKKNHGDRIITFIIPAIAVFNVCNNQSLETVRSQAQKTVEYSKNSTFVKVMSILFPHYMYHNNDAFRVITLNDEQLRKHVTTNAYLYALGAGFLSVVLLEYIKTWYTEREAAKKAKAQQETLDREWKLIGDVHATGFYTY